MSGGLLDQPPLQHSINRPCSGQIAQGFVKHYLEKCQEQRLDNLSAACRSAWLSWWGVFSLCPVSWFILWLLIYKHCLTAATFSITKKNSKNRSKLATYRHITYLLSIPSTQFLVSLLIPFFHIPSVASLLFYPWLFWINYRVFTAQRWETSSILPEKALN